MAERKDCPWCDGEVVIDTPQRKIAHSYPECPTFLAALKIHPPATSTIEFLDENGDPMPGRKGQA